MPPPPAPSRWKWALVLSIPDGLVGTYFFGFHGLNQLQRLGYVSAETAGAMVAAVILVCLGGLPLGVMGAGLGGLISWPLAKYAAHRWGLIGAIGGRPGRRHWRPAGRRWLSHLCTDLTYQLLQRASDKRTSTGWMAITMA